MQIAHENWNSILFSYIRTRDYNSIDRMCRQLLSMAVFQADWTLFYLLCLISQFNWFIRQKPLVIVNKTQWIWKMFLKMSV